MNRFLYTRQLKNETIPEFKQHDKWKLNVDKTEINWKLIYSNTFIQTIDSKLRNFQYNFLMRIVPKYDLVLKYKIKSSNLCDFYNMNIESQKHIFWECNHTQHFWAELTSFLETKIIHFRFSLIVWTN